MSRIGIQPITIPQGVTIKVEGDEVTVSSDKISNSIQLPREISVAIRDSNLLVSKKNELTQTRALHGTVRSLINSMVIGVTTGFIKKLELIGLGYRAALENNVLVMQLGFTHPIRLSIPGDLTVTIEKNIITVSGHDKQKVGEFAAKVRSSKRPEPYKGKGVRYLGEIVKLKQGKAAKGAA